MRSLQTITLVVLLAVSSFARNLVINEVMSANVSIITDEDEDYPDWLEIYNPGDSLIDLSGFGLSDDVSEPYRWVFPEVELAGREYLLVFASGKDRVSPNLHTNFKITSSGEPLILTNPSGETVDQIETGSIPSDISRGCQPEGSSIWCYFAEPTPESSNSTQGYQEIAQPPEFSLPGGFYSGSVILSLEAPSPQAAIHYTVDGSPPVDTSNVYTTPLIIDSTVVIRARVFEPGLLFSAVVTHSYIFYDNNNLTVISISTHPDNLWDEETGIYVLGNSPGSPPWYTGANFWQDWERPIHLEFFEPEGSLGFSIDAGVKIIGGFSRTFDQKSLAIFARDKYVYDLIEHQIFSDKPIAEFKSFFLRNSGNDWPLTMIRDALMTGLVEDTDLDIQAYRPSILFLNGEYWGIHNVRERMDKYYLASNRGFDPDNINLLENNAVVIEGDAEHYNAMIDFIESHDMSLMENYEYVKTQMDVYNFMDYEASEIYFSNTDWPGNNIKYWCPSEPEEIWKWMLYDTDFGFGCNPPTYTHNTLAYATDPNGIGQNPPWSTFLLGSLLENDSFKNDFINHSADLMNVNFHPDRVLERIDSLAGVIEPEMPAHQARWGRTMEQWYSHLETVIEFAENRVDYVREDIQEYFDLEGTASVALGVEPPGSGRIKINTKTISEFPWSGIYFQGVPLQLTGLHNCGYRFSGWIGAEPADSISILLELEGDTAITAVFEPDSTLSNSVIITEINYNSAINFDPEDWLEFYNRTDSSMDISGWIFRDSNDSNAFIFPPNTLLESYGLLVLCRDTTAFSLLFPEVDNYIGNIDFRLSNGGELIRLFDRQDDIVDSLIYDDDPPWPPEPDGNGPTLELIDPSLPNEDPGNWRASVSYHGSPGENNGWVGVEEIKMEGGSPREFRLFPAYPNPFNPITTISFDLSAAGEIALVIYDIGGREISRLVEGYRQPGFYQATFDGSGLSSGVYFARLTAGSFQETSKLLLIK